MQLFWEHRIMFHLKRLNAAIVVLAIFTVLFYGCEKASRQMVETIELSQNWQFGNKDSELRYKAVVPGTVHTDLLKNNLIADPFYGCNEKELQWIEQCDWQYQTTFEVDSQLLKHQNISLVFNGLDTYAHVFVNNQLLLKTNNMHRAWESLCKERLQLGTNTITIDFKSAIAQYKADSAALNHHLPGGQWAFARKAAYHFGWDWGPRFVTAGIYKPIYLKMWNNHRPQDFFLSTKNIRQNKATIQLAFSTSSAIPEDATLTIVHKETEQTFDKRTIKLAGNNQKHQYTFDIHQPKLWWTNGLGDPHVYTVQIEIATESGYKHEITLPLPIMTLKATLQNDDNGQALFVELNGHKIYMKGANYIPMHSFLSEVKTENYRQVVETARNTNMNMLRVWGGGVYENDEFYEICLRNGILIWQDFMFACSMYPYDSSFQNNVQQEAEYQVKRLRKHANIAIWCGNNEVDEAWHNWGYHKSAQFTKHDSANMWEGYKKIFHDILPKAVYTHDASTLYISTSPLYGWGRKESMTHGSAHYWGVWWGVEPYETYLQKVPRFMSEFGLQAMPSMATIHEFQDPKADSLFSPSLQCHQKHPTGYETIAKYLQVENLKAQTLEDFIYMSQIVQAKGIGLGIEAQRKAKPYCMGSLYWQINDCWPVASWSSTDFYGDAKALQYKAKQLFDDIMISIILQNDSVNICLVSDRLQNAKGTFSVNTISPSGKRVLVINQIVEIEANGVLHIANKPKHQLFENIDLSTTLIESVFEDTSKKTYMRQDFLVKTGDIALCTPNIHINIKKEVEGYSIYLSTDVVAPFVQLYLTDSHGKFNRNFINIIPNTNETVFCKTNLSTELFRSQLKIRSLTN